MTTAEPMTDTRLAFLGPDWEAHAREALATIRHGPRGPGGRPCLRCGTEHSRQWHPSPWKWGNRRSSRAWVCLECADALATLDHAERMRLIAARCEDGRDGAGQTRLQQGRARTGALPR